MSYPKTRKYTAEEFLMLTPESNSERYELYDGEITALAAPSIIHQRLARDICFKFTGFVKENKGSCEPFQSPVDVKLDNRTVVQPDVMIVCDPSKLDEKRCNGAPDLAVEIVSSDADGDYDRKFSLYKNFGVREYWIVNPKTKMTVVYTFGKHTEIEFYPFDKPIPVGIWDGRLEINIEELLNT